MKHLEIMNITDLNKPEEVSKMLIELAKIELNNNPSKKWKKELEGLMEELESKKEKQQ